MRTEKEIRDKITELEKQASSAILQPTTSTGRFFCKVAMVSLNSIEISHLKWVLGEEVEKNRKPAVQLQLPKRAKRR